MATGEVRLDSSIRIGRMPQQIGVIVAEEDWTGITSPAQRRALQNRINQRAYRRRRAKERQKQRQRLKAQSKSGEKHPINTENAPASPEASSSGGQYSDTGIVIPADREDLICQSDPPSPEGMALCRLSSVQHSKIIQRFENWAARNRMFALPNANHLLVLVKFNIWRALVTNTVTLGLRSEDTLDDDAISPFNTMSPGRLNIHLPPSLYPTKLQQTVIHHPWIDMIPIAGMRDNLISAGDSYDDMALCGDLVGFHGPSRIRRGMIIWGEAWDPWAWEVTEPFLEYWGWTMKECREIYESTNYWRAKRGEPPLRWSTFDSLTKRSN